MPPSRLKSSWKRLKKPKLSPRSRPSISQTWSRTNLVTKWKQEAQEHAGASARSPRAESRPALRADRQTDHATGVAEKRLSKNLALNLTPNARLALIEREEDRVVPVLLQARLLSVSRPCPAAACTTRRGLHENKKSSSRSPRQEVLVKKSSSRSPRQAPPRRVVHQAPLSRPSRQEHRVYPYLLRDLSIERPDQVWGVDIPFIRLRGHSLYPLARRLPVPGGVPGLVLASGGGVGAVRNFRDGVCVMMAFVL